MIGEADHPNALQRASPSLAYTGVDDKHLHGQLTDTTPWLHIPWVEFKNDAERDEAHYNYKFNSKKSRSISVDRPTPEYQDAKCKSLPQPSDSTGAWVIITFNNEEPATLIRTVHSVLNNSKPENLHGIVLVDDLTSDEMGRMPSVTRNQVVQHLLSLPKTSYIRLKERMGLMRARQVGAQAVIDKLLVERRLPEQRDLDRFMLEQHHPELARDVLVFLDSHVEASPGWLHQLLREVEVDWRALVMPGFDPSMRRISRMQRESG